LDRKKIKTVFQKKTKKQTQTFVDNRTIERTDVHASINDDNTNERNQEQCRRSISQQANKQTNNDKQRKEFLFFKKKMKSMQIHELPNINKTSNRFLLR
jgi:hypothetical protein